MYQAMGKVNWEDPRELETTMEPAALLTMSGEIIDAPSERRAVFFRASTRVIYIRVSRKAAPWTA